MTVLQPASMTPEPTNRLQAAKLGIAHAFGISLEVIGFDADSLGHLWIGGDDGTKRRHQLFDFALVQQAPLVDLHPSLLFVLVVGMQPAGQVPKVLAGVVQVEQSRPRRENAGRLDSRSIRPHRP